MLTERQLVALSRSGDTAAFGTLVDRHRVLALRLAYAIVGDGAEDAVQDAFLKAFRKLASFRDDADSAPWIYTIVLNESRNRRRSRTRRQRLELRVRPLGDCTVESAEDSAAAGPCSNSESARRLRDLMNATAKLWRCDSF